MTALFSKIACLTSVDVFVDAAALTFAAQDSLQVKKVRTQLPTASGKTNISLQEVWIILKISTAEACATLPLTIALEKVENVRLVILEKVGTCDW